MNLYRLRNLQPEFSQYLVAALLSQLPDDPSSTIIAVKSDSNAAAVNGQKNLGDGPIYDPALVYILELCTVLSLKDENSIRQSGAEVSEALQNVMRDSANYHPTLIARAVFYLLSLLHASYVCITEPHPGLGLTKLVGSLIHKSPSCAPYDLQLQKGVT